MEYLTALGICVAYIFMGVGYASLKRILFKNVKRLKAEKKPVSRSKRLLCIFFWPLCLGEIPVKKYKYADSWAESGEDYFLDFTLWLMYLVGNIFGSFIFVPIFISKELESNENNKLEKVNVDSMLPVARVYYELMERKRMITEYRNDLNNTDDVYAKLDSEISAILNDVDAVVRDYQKYDPDLTDEFPGESKIYSIALENQRRLSSYRSQVRQKKDVLMSLLNEVLSKINDELDQVQEAKNQEDKNVNALKILSGLDQRAREVDLRTKAYFNDKVLSIMSMLDSLMADARGQDLVKSALEQIRNESQNLNLTGMELGNSENYNKLEIHSLTVFELIDEKIEKIKDELAIKPASIIKLNEKSA